MIVVNHKYHETTDHETTDHEYTTSMDPMNPWSPIDGDRAAAYGGLENCKPFLDMTAIDAPEAELFIRGYYPKRREI